MSYTCYCTYTFLFWSLVVCCCLCAFCKLYPTKCTYGHLGVIETHWKVGVNQSLNDCISLALIPAVDGAESRQRALDDVRGGGAYLTLRQANALIAEQLNGGRGDGDGGDIGSESSCDLNRGWWEMCQCCRSNTANWSKNQSIDHLRAYGSIAEDVDSIDEQQTVWCSQKLKRKGWDSTQELAWQPVQHTHTHTHVWTYSRSAFVKLDVRDSLWYEPDGVEGRVLDVQLCDIVFRYTGLDGYGAVEQLKVLRVLQEHADLHNKKSAVTGNTSLESADMHVCVKMNHLKVTLDKSIKVCYLVRWHERVEVGQSDVADEDANVADKPVRGVQLRIGGVIAPRRATCTHTHTITILTHTHILISTQLYSYETYSKYIFVPFVRYTFMEL